MFLTFRYIDVSVLRRSTVRPSIARPSGPLLPFDPQPIDTPLLFSPEPHGLFRLWCMPLTFRYIDSLTSDSKLLNPLTSTPLHFWLENTPSPFESMHGPHHRYKNGSTISSTPGVFLLLQLYAHRLTPIFRLFSIGTAMLIKIR